MEIKPDDHSDEKLDPETGAWIKRHHMTAAESRAWWAGNLERWRAALCDRTKPPGPLSEWAWSDLHGWVRR